MAWWVVARLTLADALRNPVSWAATGVSLLLVALSLAFGMFTFDAEDRMRLLATAGVATATIHGLFLSCFLASLSIRAELESRTAMTLFAAPVGRGAWLLGKAAGVWLAVAATMAVVAAVHVGAMAVGWATGFEFDRPDRGFDPRAALPWGRTLAGHALAMLQVAVLAAMAATAALRLGLAAALAAVGAAFVAAHLAAQAGIPLVVVPALDLYQADDALQGLADPVGPAWLLGAALHTVLAAGGWILLGLALFRDRDIP
ncbi:MAG: hypothetical protein RLZZ127_2052 [Planctomycetota bacterium]|jgi:hypothetical protein